MFEKYVLRNAFYYVLEAVSDFQTAYGNDSICVKNFENMIFAWLIIAN